jgi:L-lactate dehydrogenase (cytochrome)
MALGASGCLIGRAHLYGLAAMGEAGVTRVLEIIKAELSTYMALTGLVDLDEVSAGLLDTSETSSQAN